MQRVHATRDRSNETSDRFVKLFRRRQAAGSPLLKKTVSIMGGLTLLMAGVLLLAFPGPGVLLILAGGTMMAQYSLYVAKALDKSEIWVRRMVRRPLRAWRSASLPVKAMILVLAAALLSLPAFAGLRYYF